MIKTKLIESTKGRLLVLDLPKEFKVSKNKYGRISIKYQSADGFNNTYNILEDGTDWKFIGKPSKVTEKQAKGIVESFDVGDNKPAYENYIETDRYTNTATESLQSLIEANVPLKNPLGEKPPKAICMIGGMELLVRESVASKVSARRLTRWKEAEESVFHNPILFWEGLKL